MSGWYSILQIVWVSCVVSVVLFSFQVSWCGCLVRCHFFVSVVGSVLVLS